jgi:hypothetical protein
LFQFDERRSRRKEMETSGHYSRIRPADATQIQEEGQAMTHKFLAAKSEDEFDEECGKCVGDGWVVADCFEDTCCCLDPENEHGLVRCQCNPKPRQPREIYFREPDKP